MLPLEEGVRAVGDLIRQGKLRYFGVSNFRGWRIAEIARLADQLGIDRPVASEPLYNIVDRTAEVEQLPAAAHYGLGVVSYSPLARGVLSGKYAVDAPPPADSRAGARRQAHPPDRVATGVAENRANHRRSRGRARHDLDRVRSRVGAQEPAGQRHHRRSPDRSAMG